ncbi:histone-lysine N-methyltransferase SMYD3-like [Culicoides brevitarsis]|uniref:histone-lysine N-methyltransferase SMYD3-like n=1 Tax=Culicoides brevitarsis TaxID=469753 RepID=UPI00307BBF1E
MARGDKGGPAAKFEGIRAGTTILKEDPFACILYSRYRKVRCDHCFKKGNIKLCLGCRFVGYCSNSCQSFGWAQHKIECPHLGGLKHPDQFPDEARLIARIVWRLTSGGDTDRGYYAKGEYRTFGDLMSHLPNISSDVTRMERFNEIYDALQQLLTEKYMPSYPVVLHIYGQICVNSYHIVDEDMANAGQGIYLAASIVDHSCVPNAVATFEGSQLSITLTQDIEGTGPVNWSQIFISYVDNMTPTELRQNEIFDKYYFVCACPRCSDETESMKMIAAECPNPKCDNILDLRKDIYLCPICEKEIDPEHKDMYNYLMEFTPLKLYEMAMNDTAYLDILQVMVKMQKGVFSTNNIWYLKTLEAAFDSATIMERYDQAIEYGKALIPGYENYYGTIHPSTAIIQMKVGKLLADQERNLEAYGCLRSAADILEITHGTEHSVYINLVEPSLRKLTAINEDHMKAAKAAAAREAANKPPPPPEEEAA